MPGTPEEGPPALARRKLLLAGGFLATNGLVLARMRDPRVGSTAPGSSEERGVVPPPEQAVATEPSVLAGHEPAPEDTDPERVWDLVLLGGRVMDPETGFDGVANVAIDGERIGAISRDRLRGTEEIDVSGLVVSPGFIDILSYDPNPYGIWYKIADGVTTNLGMHGIDSSAEDFFGYYDRDGFRPPTHFGGAFDNPQRRSLDVGLDTGDEASRAQIAELVELARTQIAEGWIGIDVEPEYTPGISYAEIRALGEVAAEHRVPLFFHGRYSDPDPPGTNAETLDEILRTARATGCAVHVEHITSTGGTFTMEESLATLDDARADGIDVTACLYPYDYWATYLGSPRFSDDWQERFRISYDDLEVAGTGQRVTRGSFSSLRADNVLVAAHNSIPEDEIDLALKRPWTMIGSDAILEESHNNHPRCSGAFARTLGRYVREREVITLMEGLAKMTILPARRLETGSAAMARKGRLQIGADADLCVFDPETVEDQATVKDPAQMSTGIEWVLVLGQIVKDPEGPREDVTPGQAIRWG